MRRRIEDKRRKRMSAEDRRKAILETTVSFISQFGFWGFTIRDVAQAQNITEAGLLYYFKSKEQLLEETLKYADRTNQIAIAEHLGVQGVTGEVLDDGIAYHCDLGLKAISTGTVETNADRPEMVRLYTLLESEALSKDHPVHEYFEQREINLLKEYAFAAERDGSNSLTSLLCNSRCRSCPRWRVCSCAGSTDRMTSTSSGNGRPSSTCSSPDPVGRRTATALRLSRR